MIDILIAVAHWCASCVPAGAGVPPALGAFGGAAGAAGGMGGMGGVAGGGGAGAGAGGGGAGAGAGGGPGSSGDGSSGTEGSTSDGAPYSAPGSSPSTSGYGSSAAEAAAAQAAATQAAAAASAANVGRNDAIEPDPIGQAIPGLFVGAELAAGEAFATSLTAGAVEAAGTATGEGVLTTGEETGAFDAVGGAAKNVGSFFASPFNPSANNPDLGDAGLGGPDATVPDPGHAGTTEPDAGSPSKDPEHP